MFRDDQFIFEIRKMKTTTAKEVYHLLIVVKRDFFGLNIN